MKNTLSRLGLLLVIAVFVSGCSQMRGYQPQIDTSSSPAYQGTYGAPQSGNSQYGGPQYGPQRYGTPPRDLNRDMMECQNFAEQNHSAVKDTALGAGVGALIGAAGGAAIGAITGDPGRGAALGAAAGGIGGGGYQGYQSSEGYRNAMNSCMRQRGWTVIQ